jgi:uncharacterized protein (DUF58 family)
MDTATLLKKVRRIEIKTRGLSKQLFSGEYHSAFKGRGMSFSEVRTYLPGDDVRSIDWNVTARTGEPHVKIFEEERELTLMLLVDVSASVYFGTNNTPKNDLITEICAVLAFSAAQNNDKVGLILFSDDIELYIPPKKGRTHVLRIIRELIYHESSSRKTNINKALEYFSNIHKKKSIVFVFSDFYSESFNQPLKFAAKKHDVVGLHLYDQVEEDFPNVGMLRYMNPETGEVGYIDTANKKIRKQIADDMINKKQLLTKTFYRAGAEVLHLETEKPYTPVLMNFFKKRAQ